MLSALRWCTRLVMLNTAISFQRSLVSEVSTLYPLIALCRVGGGAATGIYAFGGWQGDSFSIASRPLCSKLILLAWS